MTNRSTRRALTLTAMAILPALLAIYFLGCPSSGIDDLTLDENPGCAISCVVRWSTSTPSTSSVEFGEAGQLTHRIGRDELVTEHEVVVVGMHPEREYRLQAVSVSERGDEWRSGDLTFRAGDLPYSWMTGEVDIDVPGLREPGWTLANVCTGVFCPTVVVMLDETGQPVWYHVDADESGRADIEATWMAGDRVLVGPGVASGRPVVQLDLQGQVVWEGPAQPDLGEDDFLDLIADGLMHHTMHPTADGNIITVLFELQGDALGDVIWEFDEDLQTTWRWNAFDHLQLDPDDLGLLGEWTHFNSVVVDPDEDVVYVNSWNLDHVYKIARADGAVLWTLGEGGDFTPDPTAEYPWFDGAHSVEFLGNDRFLLYDNGGGNRPFSRLVEYQLDPVAMSATLAWEYPGPGGGDEWYNYSWGEVDPLPNGNRLMSAGNGSQGYDQTRIQEVTPDGEIAWRMWWTLDEEVAAGSFQVQRIPALAKRL